MGGKAGKEPRHDVEHQSYGAAMLEAFTGISSEDLADARSHGTFPRVGFTLAVPAVTRYDPAMLFLRKPSKDRLHTLLHLWHSESLSYLPDKRSGFIHDDHSILLGSGDRVYQQACQALDHWLMFPTWAEVARLEACGQKAGQIVAMTVRICGLWWVNPCRILRRCDTEMTQGFVYGTLPEHAECGEEMFAIERQTDGSVWYVIRAFSRPSHCLAWLGFPLARWWQCRFVRDSQHRMLCACD
jgi:uncharacterized protein (UPF0548 family)